MKDIGKERAKQENHPGYGKLDEDHCKKGFPACNTGHDDFHVQKLAIEPSDIRINTRVDAIDLEERQIKNRPGKNSTFVPKRIHNGIQEEANYWPAAGITVQGSINWQRTNTQRSGYCSINIQI